MKKKIVLFLTVFTVLFLSFSCSDDDDTEEEVNLLVGSWQCTNYEGYETVDGVKKPYQNVTDDSAVITTFHKNGTMSENGEVMAGYTYTCKKDLLIIDILIDGIHYVRTFVVLELESELLIVEIYAFEETGDGEFLEMTYKRVN
jgi:hypothetical protein